jgi:benzodiazapine receptor
LYTKLLQHNTKTFQESNRKDSKVKMSLDEDKLESNPPAVAEEESNPGLNIKNYANIVGYIFNAVFVFGVGNLGWFGLPDNSELSEKYQTIITPKGTAFAIWSVIYTFQAIFAIMQLFPAYRAKPMVQSGVGYWYLSACIAQIAWTFSFATEVLALSLVCMYIILISLMGLLISQYYVEFDLSTSTCSMKGLIEFWFLRFPFGLHAGWIAAASALNTNVVFVGASASASTQLTVGIISLAVLHALSVWCLFGFKCPNYAIPLVLSWANFFISRELLSPKDLIVDTFGADIITGVSNASLSVSIIIIIQVAVRVAFLGYNYVKGTSYLQATTNEKVPLL